MSNEISKPGAKTFYVAYNDDVVHAGVTKTNQVTTSGLPNMLQDKSIDKMINQLSVLRDRKELTDGIKNMAADKEIKLVDGVITLVDSVIDSALPSN